MLFETPRWRNMLWMNSAYFPADTHTVLDETIMWLPSLSVTSNLKNYDNEIDEFVNWIMPFVDAIAGDFLGYSLYEKGRDSPKFFWKE
ncbi:hypothetical protein CDG81_09685 [Actinopolyspora erythraea]|uniref:Uncharacterized protein n=2 Tax=Actinopolyspora erythraea TaxID=414996 RepID=A0A223RRJ8_9ACTN|nr:hypothetical protein CDG81_09685 [Actinopolyspora erythraea]